MNKFYAQNVALTCAILALWAGMIGLLTWTSPAVRQQKASTTPVQQTEKVEARPEESGEETRIHRYNENQELVETEVNFKDKTKALITYNLIGRPAKMVEFYPDGRRQVFTFGMQGLSKRESFRPDNSLSSRSTPGKEGVVTRRFAADGKTVSALEEQLKGGLTRVTLFHKDGVTPRVRYQTVTEDGIKGELTTFTEKGVVRTIEKIERMPDECGSPTCPNAGAEIEVTRFREDGKTPWYRSTWSMYGGGNPTCTSIEEYHADGKTLKRRVKFSFEPTEEDKLEGDDVGVTKVVEVFNEKGKLTTVRLLRDDDSVSREETFGPDAQPLGREYFNSDAGMKEQLGTFESPYNVIEELNSLTPQEEPNHLKQLLSR